MENRAVPQDSVGRGLRFGSLTLLLASLIVTACFVSPVSAKRSLVGRDGKIHACYRVKGKPKGMVRVVRGGNYRCRRGERRMAWSVVAVVGAPGVTGATGAQGASGAAVGPGAGPGEAALKTQIGELTAKVGALEGVLEGITNEELNEAVKALPAVKSLCEQNEDLAEQVNLLAEAFEGLGLNGVLTGIGGLLEIPPLPKALESFGC